MHDIQSYEEALKKAQQIETNDDETMLSSDKKVEEKLEMLQKITPRPHYTKKWSLMYHLHEWRAHQRLLQIPWIN